MAFIRTIPPAEARDRLAELYRTWAEPDGSVDHVFQAHSLNPEGLAAHGAVYRAAMSGTRGLRKADRELIAVAVSHWNGCHY